MKRLTFIVTFNAVLSSGLAAFAPTDRFWSDVDAFQFSDDEDEYNYYTGSDEENEGTESTNQESGHSRIRAFMAMIVPLLASGGLGIFLYKK